jgi:fructoselysine-6-P-deglycase FrlB-like protein
LNRLDDVNRVAIVGVDPSPVSEAADLVVTLDFADEQSVVQTRFATSVVALFRALLGDDVEQLARAAETVITGELPDVGKADHFVFLSTGAGVGLAHEAALKFREAALVGTESYAALEYRHGPIALADPSTIVWFFGPPPDGLVDEITNTGARVITHTSDPLVELVLAQRVAIAIAERKGLDPDNPRHLSRSVVLPASA